MREAVAIVGMGAVFPGAPDLDTFWSNIERGVDAITGVPATRLDPVHLAGFQCKRGGFVEATFDPIAFGIMPRAAATAEPDQLLALHVAAAALDDAAIAVPRERTGVILGRGGYLTPGMARLSNRVRTAQQLATTLGELLPDLDADTVARIRAAFEARAGELGAEAAIGLVPNLAASRIANRLDLRGPAYTVDAACASSLLAVDQACRELADRRCDLVVAGGVHVCHDVTFWSVFTQLGALSKSSHIRPFDRRADGIVIGEGAGIVILKRLADAERDGDRIYATILGTGVSSDGRESSAMRPRADGQLAAIDQAWRSANRSPDAVGIVEAHGTATPTGDEVELAALGQFFGTTSGARAGLGSVKSMIGHAMPAAGVAGLIKTALAIHHGVIPPSLHCEQPNEALAKTRFRVLAKAEPWEVSSARLAGVSAFGFGGINAHVVLEGPSVAKRRVRAAATPRVLALTGVSIDDLRAGLAGRAATPGPLRMALLDPTPQRLELANKVLDRGKAWRGNHDIWFAPQPLAADGGKLAFVFPGVEATFAVTADDVAHELGITAPEIASAAGADANDVERRGHGVFALGRLLATALAKAGIEPDAYAGHSLGEWTGMVVSELIPRDAADAFVRDLPAGALEVPDVVFAAVGCSATGAREALDGLHDISVSHDNCPHQSIVCGRRDAVRTAIDRLGKRGVLCQELPFKSGFHSPLLADYLGLHRKHLADLALQAPRIPLWSATTCAPYPADPAAVRKLAIDHLVQPVRFRELVEAMYADGVRAFVQLGVGSTAGFVDDTLRGRDHLALSAATAKGAGLTQLARVRAALFADGFVDSATDAADTTHATGAAKTRGGMTLQLGVPLVRLDGLVAPLSLAAHAAHGDREVAARVRSNLESDLERSDLERSDDPIVAELLATLDEAAAASRAVVDAYRESKRVAPTHPRDTANPRGIATSSAAIAAAGATHPLVGAANPRAGATNPPTGASAGAANPRELVVRRSLSVASDPHLLDHCFYRQPPSSTSAADRYPVVPMTMTIGMMIDAARELCPGLVAIAVEDVRALRWMAVEPAIEIAVHAKRRDGGADGATDDAVVDVDIAGYASARVRFATAYAPAPVPQLAPLSKPHAAPHSAEQMYADRWMFHGPAYQGVTALGPVGIDGNSVGVDGAIDTLAAPGALLDCAGQLMGWWVMHTQTRDRLAMPVHIARIELFGPHPATGVHTACSVRMREVGEQLVRADLEVAVAGRVWARITGWQDRRFDSDDAVWAVLMYPEHNVLAVAEPEGYVSVTEHWRGSASRELMMRRYLGERERVDHDAIGPRGKRGWLLGRIAIKDAVRLHRWRGGDRRAMPLWPVEVAVANEPSGQPVVAGMHVSVSHKDDRAVAIVDELRAVGIDLERIEPRSETFTTIAYTQAELDLGAGRDRDEWHARLWAAKEAVAKALGTGMTDPKRFEVRAADGDTLTVVAPSSGTLSAPRGPFSVATKRDGGYIVAWTYR